MAFLKQHTTTQPSPNGRSLPPKRWFNRWYAPVLAIATLGLVLAFGWRSPAHANEVRYHDELSFPPLRELTLPDYERYSLPNGMTVYLQENHELPLIEGQAYIRTGNRWEDASHTGLAGITGSLIRSGGTTEHTATELAALLESRAAGIESSIGTTSGSLSLSALTEDFDFVLGLTAEVLRQPAFPEERLALIKKQISGNIARRNDNPSGITGREFSKLIYGDTSPYARTIEYSTLDAISRDDVVAFYDQYVTPDHIILGISGDFEAATAKALIEKYFGDWQPSGNALPPVPSAQQVKTSGTFIVDRPELTQSSIRLGHLSGLVSSDDYPALSVMNGILNGFGGRLFNELRSRQGLAYSVYGFWSANYDYPGLFLAGGQTRTESTATFIDGIKGEINRLRTEPLSEQELNYAKDSTLNSFVFNFASPLQVLSRLMTYDYYGYPSDFLFQYQQGIRATTTDDIERVANQYLKPDQLVTLIVGDKAEITPLLSSSAGTVQELDITIPPATSS